MWGIDDQEDVDDYDNAPVEDFDDDSVEDFDICYDCSANGDDYFFNNEGELECACLTCPFFDR